MMQDIPGLVEDQVNMIGIGELRESPLNPRRRVGEDMKDLVASVRAQGVVQPLVVRPVWTDVDGPDGDDQEIDHFEVVAGHRRLRAAAKAGLEQVPCVVRELDDGQARQIMLVENLQRVDLTPPEEGRAILELVEAGMTQRELAERIGRSRKFVDSRLRLMELHPRMLKAVEDGVPLSQVDKLEELQRRAPELLEDEDLKVQLDTAIVRLAEGNSWMLGSMVDQAVRRRIVREIVAKIEERGVAYIVRDSYEMPNGVKLLESKGTQYESRVLEGVDARAHAKEPCHGLVVDLTVSPPEARKACLEAKRHTKAGKSELKPEVGEEELKRREEEREARSKVRRMQMAVSEARRRAVAAARTSDRELSDALMRRLVATTNQTQRKAMCRMLDLEFDDESYDGPAAAIAEFMDGGRRQLTQVALAAALTMEVYGQSFGSEEGLSRLLSGHMESVDG